MTAPLLLGIDIGTGGVRVLLVDGDLGTVIDRSSATWPTSVLHAGWSEQDPDRWWIAAATAIGDLTSRLDDPNRIGAVAFAGQMHGLVLRDADDRPLRPAILWNDQRTAAQCDAIHRSIGRDRCIQLTGKPILTGFTAPKLAWVKEHEPDIARRIHSISLPKDHVMHRATGVHAIDVADASGTSWLDIESRRWSREMCDRLEVDMNWLPTVHECSEIVGSITTDAAAMTGLAAGTPVVAGAGDQAASGLACGVIADGQVSITIGTSGVVFAHSDQPPADPDGRLHGFCHAVEGGWHRMGCMLSAGGSLEWFRNTLAPDRTFDEIVTEAMTAPPGSGGLCFLPYLSGERCPHDDPTARGAFIGLSSNHRREHLARAVLEGVSFGLADMLQCIRATGRDVESVRLAGGAARNPLWRQLLADVLAVRIETVNEPDATAYGAAMLASVGAGLHDDAAAAARRMVRVTDVIEPTGFDYGPNWATWRTMYPDLAEPMRRLSD